MLTIEAGWFICLAEPTILHIRLTSFLGDVIMRRIAHTLGIDSTLMCFQGHFKVVVFGFIRKQFVLEGGRGRNRQSNRVL